MREAYFPEAKQLNSLPRTSGFPATGNGLLGELPGASGILSTSHNRVQCLVKKEGKPVVSDLRRTSDTWAHAEQAQERIGLRNSPIGQTGF